MIFKSLQSFFRGQNTKSQNNNFLNGYMDKLYLFKRTVNLKTFWEFKNKQTGFTVQYSTFQGLK